MWFFIWKFMINQQKNKKEKKNTRSLICDLVSSSCLACVARVVWKTPGIWAGVSEIDPHRMMKRGLHKFCGHATVLEITNTENNIDMERNLWEKSRQFVARTKLWPSSMDPPHTEEINKIKWLLSWFDYTLL